MSDVIFTNERCLRQFKGVWIPSEIWLSDQLSWAEKCLWAEIDSLSSNERPCSASNEYLATMLQTTASNVAKTLSKFRQLGLIKDIHFDGKIREMITSDFTPELRQTLLPGKGSLYSQVNIDTSIDTSIEKEYKEKECLNFPSNPFKTLFPIPKKKKKAEYLNSFLFQNKEFAEEWINYLEARKKAKGAMTDRALCLVIEKLEKRPSEALNALRMAIEAGWRGFEWDWYDSRCPKQQKQFNPPYNVKL